MSTSLARRAATPAPFGTHFRGLDRVFDDFFGSPARSGLTLFPAVEVRREEDKVLINAEIPGIDKKDIDLVIEDNVLTIEGHKQSEVEEKDESRHYSERRYGKFSRRIALGDGVDPAKAKADYKNGILSISIPIDEAKSNKFRVSVK